MFFNNGYPPFILSKAHLDLVSLVKRSEKSRLNVSNFLCVVSVADNQAVLLSCIDHL